MTRLRSSRLYAGTWLPASILISSLIATYALVLRGAGLIGG